MKGFSFSPSSLRNILALLGCCAILTLSSCKGKDGPKLYPAKGKVTLADGEIPAGATVILQPVGASDGDTKKPNTLRPSGKVTSDGTFVLSTHPHGEGAPAGEYAVLVTWYPENARELDNPSSMLPPVYASAETTPIPKVTIQEGPNELAPITLEAKRLRK